MNKNITHNNLTYIVLGCLTIIGLKINANENSFKDIEWEIIRSNKISDSEESIKWEIIEESKYRNKKDNTKNEIRKSNKEINTSNNLLQLGKSVPTANTLSKGELILETSHVSTFDGGMSGGIGNQNYSGLIQYGISKNLTSSLFYTEADDPLYKKIDDLLLQPENNWSNYGIDLKWKVINKNIYKLAIKTSLENWKVGSGGCYGYNCNNISNNIFNYERSKVVNNNFIASISIPITWTKYNSLSFTFSPSLVLLPEEQGDKYGSGKYYGNNYGVGLGISYSLGYGLTPFYSSYIPLNSTNSFNKELNYRKVNIHTLGLNYTVDPKIGLEGYITNSFGQTPATSILTIPSSNELIYGGRFIYKPKEKSIKNLKKIIENKNGIYEGLIVNTTDLVSEGEKIIITDYSEVGSINIKGIIGLSENFNLEFNNEHIASKNNKKEIYTTKYLTPRNSTIRGGGTVILISEDRGDIITSGLRLTYGRVIGNKRNGYLFSELINAKTFNKNLKGTASIRRAITGTGNLTSIGISAIKRIKSDLYIIPEINFGIQNTNNTYNIALRKKLLNRIHVDTYIANSIGQNDMSQLINGESMRSGVKIRIKI